MKVKALARLLFFLLLVAVCGCGTKGNVSVRGRVFVSIGPVFEGNPASGAQVRLWNANESYSTTTDNLGGYGFRGAYGGTYSITASYGQFSSTIGISIPQNLNFWEDKTITVDDIYLYGNLQ